MDSYVNPEEIFTNSDFHGITASNVIAAPIFKDIYPKIRKHIEGEVVFSHNLSDRTMLNEACDLYDLDRIDVNWLNSATVVRRTWTQFKESGYGVEVVSEFLKIEYTPHNAASDAYATAVIIKTASEVKEYSSIEDWKLELSTSAKRDRRFRSYDSTQKIRGELTSAPDLSTVKNKENPFYGKKVVISGTYDTWPDRKDLAKIIKGLGADIDGSVGNHTEYLCAGKGVGPKKIEKMEQRIANGENVKIISELEIISILNEIDN